MADYFYKARTDAGEQVSGVIEAESEAAAVRALDEESPWLAQRRVEQRLVPRDVHVVVGQEVAVHGGKVGG